jgi:hypothetical protein
MQAKQHNAKKEGKKKEHKNNKIKYLLLVLRTVSKLNYG